MISQTMKREFKVAYLGPPASFSHQAALQLFPEDSSSTQLVPYPTIPSLFQAISSGSVSASIVPFENSTNGPVNQTLDLIAAASENLEHLPLQICGETSVRVKQCLVGRRKGWKHGTQNSHGDLGSPVELSHITSLHTHPQAWTQCTPFLNKHFGPEVTKHDQDSTSAAAELVAADVTGTSAAICSALAADVFGLDLLADGIEGEDQNETRFLVIKNGDSTNPKTSLACLIKGLAVLKTHINFPIKPTQDALADAGLGQVKIYTRNSEQMWIYFLFDNVHGEESSFDKLRGKTSEAEWYNWGTWTVNSGNVL